MEATPQRYSIMLRILHWSIAVLIAVNTCLGLYLGSQDGAAPESRYDLHKGTGVAILALVALRLVRRLGFEVALALPPMPRWQQRAARAAHVVLYILMVLIPFTGYLSSSAAGYSTHIFGVATILPLMAEDRQAYDLLRELHRALNYAAIAVIGLHIAAVVKHRFADRQDILSRML
jgi:cytochrome b561